MTTSAHAFAPVVLVVTTQPAVAIGPVEQRLMAGNVPYAMLGLAGMLEGRERVSLHVGPACDAALELVDARTGRRFTTEAVRGVWAANIRLPENPRMAATDPTALHAMVESLGRSEAWLLANGIINLLDHQALMLPSLTARLRCEHLLYQRALAAQVGLHVPDAYAGQSPARAREVLADAVDDACFVPFTREVVELDGRRFAILPRRIEPERRFALANLRAPALITSWPVLAQRCLSAFVVDRWLTLDARVRDPELDASIVDPFFHAAQDNLELRPLEAPPALATARDAFVEQAGLDYCVLDTGLDAEGRWCFLGAHPGASLDLFHEAGLPAYDHVVDRLVAGRATPRVLA